MTMFTAENRHHQSSCGGGYGGGGYGGGEVFGGYYSIPDLVVVGGPILMAEDGNNEFSRNDAESNSKAEESTSKDDEIIRDQEQEQEQEEEDEEEEGWLQLSIGGGHSQQNVGKNKLNKKENEKEYSSPSVELELMPPSSSSSNYYSNNHSQLMRPFAPIVSPEFRSPRAVVNFGTSGGGGGGGAGFISPPPSFFLQQHGISNYPQNQETMSWGFRPPFIPIVNNTNNIASSSQSYYPRPQFQLYAGVDMPPSPTVDFRVIEPPKRPHCGIWFMLQASQNQEKEPFLPQISKSYLRIKDGGMTIRLVIKYLVNKLRLDNESEIEITCKGQRVVPFLTLQHVRDSIWSNPTPNRGDFVTLLPNSSTTPHLMVLHYARSTS